ncbi:hypothetical protein A4X13_0g6142 [Tilletia indica]|uniref:HAT C-terminal dimerisation domain-containing protein n=1 Tax=Tilletia indica TaxID=43049 RepID=A0A177TII8_9BASI|nr:hypothetical protein A4X13_0g6142 [Tilletia indica]
MSSGSMSLRDAASRKLPARFAESELDLAKTSAGGKTNNASATESPSPGDKNQAARGGSPITVGPPPGYEPPPSSGASSAQPTTSTKKPPHSQTRPSLPGSSAAVPTSEDEEDDEEEIEAPPSAQRPRPRIFIPANPSPDPPSGEGVKHSTSSSSRRIQPDRDDDFFIRRKIVRDIENDPPIRSPLQVSDSDEGTDKEFIPSKKVSTSAPAKRNTTSKISEQHQKKKSQVAELEEEEEEETPTTKTKAQQSKKKKQQAAEIEEEEDTDASEEDVVDLTNSSPVRAPSLRSSVSPTKKGGPSVQRKQASLSPTKASSSKTRSSSSLKVANPKPVKGKGKAKEATKTDKKQTLLTRSSLGTLTPEDYLERAKAAWQKAHDEANARMTAESGGVSYTPPSNPASKYYLYYQEPYLKQHIDPSRDEIGIGWTCRCCLQTPYVAWRAFSDTSTSLLKSHVCTNKAKFNFDTIVKSKEGKTEGPIERYLVKKPDSTPTEPPITKMQVRTIAVAWVTEESRPISILGDKWLRALLPESRRALLPSRNTTTQEISDTYEAMQDVIAKRLAGVQGCIHLALDIWTSPNGHSFLGVIGCWQEGGCAQRHVLDMVVITKRHTAENVSACVKTLVERLNIEQKVWFVASDNASTNTAMMRILGKDNRLPLIEGESTQIRCIAHILNLISEAILLPFNKAVRDVTEEDEEEAESADDDDIDIGGDDEHDALDDDDAAVSRSLHPILTHDTEDEALIRSALAAKKVAYIQSSSSSASQPPQPTKELRTDSGEVGIQIRQLAWFARKLRYNVPLRKSFQETCVLFKMPTPHSLIRDVATRWNSTYDMVERALDLWDAIVAWQEANVKLIPAKFRIKRAHRSSLKRVVQLLKPLSDATYKFSAKAVTTIADVVGTFEELDAHFRSVEEDEDQPMAWREAARRAGAVCATYYGLSDASKIYYLAVLLHPNLRTKFMRLMKWERSWITKAEDTLKEVCEERYRITETEVESQAQSQEPEETDGTTSKKKKKKPESFVERQLALAEEEAALPAPDIIAEWCKGSIPLVKGKMVDALSWWWDQKRIGANHGGLTDLALDVFSAPATSVDVERLFSRAGHHITPLRHRLTAIKLGHIVTVGAWYREEWVPEDLLAEFNRQKQQNKLAAEINQKRKRNELAEQSEAGPSKRTRLDDATEA